MYCCHHPASKDTERHEQGCKPAACRLLRTLKVAPLGEQVEIQAQLLAGTWQGIFGIADAWGIHPVYGLPCSNLRVLTWSFPQVI